MHSAIDNQSGERQKIESAPAPRNRLHLMFTTWKINLNQKKRNEIRKYFPHFATCGVAENHGILLRLLNQQQSAGGECGPTTLSAHRKKIRHNQAIEAACWRNRPLEKINRQKMKLTHRPSIRREAKIRRNEERLAKKTAQRRRKWPRFTSEINVNGAAPEIANSRIKRNGA